MKQKTTLAEVAAAAGVSKMTASRAIRGVGEVSQANIERIRKIADELGYVGNHLATSLSSQRTDLIGVVVPSMANMVFPEVIMGISKILEQTQIQPVIGISDYDQSKEHRIIRNMLSWRPAAMIVTGVDQCEATRTLLENAETPIVQVMDLDGDPVDCCVGISHHKTGREMAETLLKAGRRKFGYIGAALERDSRAKKRYIAFQASLQDAGMDFHHTRIVSSLSSSAHGRALMAEMLAAQPDLDCIYFSNDEMAAGGLFACIAQGVNVPQDVALAGFNGLNILESLPGEIITSHARRKEMGEVAAQIALDAIAGSQTRPGVVKAFETKISGPIEAAAAMG